jgi:predicted nucleic acid-binding protein
MKSEIIIDTSPLVAFIDKSDNYHHWTVETWKKIRSPLLTCEAVIAESCFLLQDVHGGESSILSLLEAEVITIPFNLSKEVKTIRQLMKQYESVPMSVADACLVRMSELTRGSSVFTLDSDFRIYRQFKNKVIPVIMHEDNY